MMRQRDRQDLPLLHGVAGRGDPDEPLAADDHVGMDMAGDGEERQVELALAGPLGEMNAAGAVDIDLDQRMALGEAGKDCRQEAVGIDPPACRGARAR